MAARGLPAGLGTPPRVGEGVTARSVALERFGTELLAFRRPIAVEDLPDPPPVAHPAAHLSPVSEGIEPGWGRAVHRRREAKGPDIVP